MQISRPKGLLAGFHFHKPESAVGELIFCGECWAMPEWFIGAHDHPVWELYFQLDGVSEWAGPQQSYLLQPGSFLAVAPHVRHRMSKPARQKHHFYYAAIRLESVFGRHPSLRRLWSGHTLVYRPNVESVEAPFRQLVREVTLAQAQRAAGLRLALDALVLEATRTLNVAALAGWRPSGRRAREGIARPPVPTLMASGRSRAGGRLVGHPFGRVIYARCGIAATQISAPGSHRARETVPPAKNHSDYDPGAGTRVFIQPAFRRRVQAADRCHSAGVCAPEKSVSQLD